jgi:hypothetical protein
LRPNRSTGVIEAIEVLYIFWVKITYPIPAVPQKNEWFAVNIFRPAHGVYCGARPGRLDYFALRRKDAEENNGNIGFLCASAPPREK